MQLRTTNGELTLGSAYKLFVWSWIMGWAVFAIPIVLLLTVGAVLSGQMLVNGEMVYGRGAVFMQMIPLLVLFPIIIVIQAFMFGGLLTLGARIYRQWKPITVTAD